MYYTIQLHILLLLKKITSYEYVGFKFSQNDEYAQKLCMSILLFYYLQKKLQPKKKPRKLYSENQTKTGERIEPQYYEEP
jgi:hypothetical protein